MKYDFDLNLLFVIAICGYGAHVANVVHFTCFKIFTSCERLMSDFLRLIGYFYQYKFDTLSRLSIRYSNFQGRNIKKELAKKVHFNTNPYLNTFDKFQIIQVFQISSWIFFVGSATILLFLWSLYAFYMWDFTVRFQNDYDMRDFFVAASRVASYNFFMFLGIWFPFGIIFFLQPLFMMMMSPKTRHFTKIFKYCSRHHRINSRSESKLRIFYINLRNGQKLFVHSLKELKEFNDFCISTFFTRSVVTTFAGSIIFGVESMIGKSTIRTRFFMILTVVCQTIILLFFVSYILSNSMKLYDHSKSYLNTSTHLLMNFRSRSLVLYTRLCLFSEIIHTKKKYYCTIGPLGKITQRAILGLIPLYTSFIMSLIPLVEKRIIIFDK